MKRPAVCQVKPCDALLSPNNPKFGQPPRWSPSLAAIVAGACLWAVVALAVEVVIHLRMP